MKRMRLMRSGSAAAIILAGIVLGPAASAADPFELVCVPPLVESPARCTFDIYGTVTDLNGTPVQGVYVNDGGKTVVSDAEGFYDLHEFVPDSYPISYSYRGCGGTDSVTVPVEAIMTGGTRHDIVLSCAVGP